MIKVWTNGCFDVIHRGHIELLKYCKSVGHHVTVGLDSDEKVSKDKGPDRPFNKIEDRVFVIQSLKYVDEVVVFSSRDELERTIESRKPDFLVVGSDWKGKEVVGQDYARKVLFFNRIDGYSTTKILDSK